MGDRLMPTREEFTQTARAFFVASASGFKWMLVAWLFVSAVGIMLPLLWFFSELLEGEGSGSY